MIVDQILTAALGVVGAPIIGPYIGIKFILEGIQSEVNRELLDEGRIIGRLTELQSRYESGEEGMTEEGYVQEEEQIMDRLAAVREYKREMEEAGYLWDQEKGRFLP